jgi:hypothetical protein
MVGGGMRKFLLTVLAGLWLGGSLVMADGQAAFKAALDGLQKAKTEQQVEDAFEKGAIGIVGDPEVATYKELLEAARGKAWVRVALPEGIKVTHAGVKPGATAQGKVVPMRVFGFEVTGAYPVKEVWGSVIWMDVKGNVLAQRQGVCLFTAASDAEAIQPGKSIVKERDLFLDPPGTSDGKPEAGVQAMVLVIKVLHVQK